jgi:hypothetical protein
MTDKDRAFFKALKCYKKTSLEKFFRKKEAFQEGGQADDKGGDWMKDPLLKIFVTKPERPLAESPEVDYAIFKE